MVYVTCNVAGSVWVFGNYADVMNDCPGSTSCCNHDLIKFAIAVTIIDWIIYVLLILLIVCVVCCVFKAASGAAKSKKRTQQSMSESQRNQITLATHTQPSKSKKAMLTLARRHSDVEPHPKEPDVKSDGDAEKDVEAANNPVPTVSLAVSFGN